MIEQNAIDLQRFIESQDGTGPGTTYAEALEEMQQGIKQSCWIWYVFPQFLDPARASSKNNQRFQIRSKAEAIAFLQDETLGPRFIKISRAVIAALEKNDAREAMGGSVDAKKLHQSVTVFHLAAKEAGMEETESLLHKILEQMFREPGSQFEFEDRLMKQTWEELSV